MADTEELRKLRGAFFTPPAIADFLVDWAVRTATDRVLEPSCGEAAFLLPASVRLRTLGAGMFIRDQLHGVDIHPESVAGAGKLLRDQGSDAELSVGDFFSVPPTPRFDAVIG